MRGSRFRSIIVGMLLAFVTACGGSGGAATTAVPASQGSQVTIDNFSFLPSTLTVSAGDAVTWTNEQGVTHTVTADGGEFDSGRLGQGAEFSQTFGTAGTFAYHCTIHPSMTGTITVDG